MGSIHVQREREIKLLLGDDGELPELDGLGGLAVRPLGTHDLGAAYWDTEEARLEAWGCSLRHREGCWTAKFAIDADIHTLIREEVAVDGSPEKIPDEITGLVWPFTRGRQLAPIAHLTVRRRAFAILGPDGRQVAVLTDDSVDAHGTGVTRPHFREVEVEFAHETDRGTIAPVVEALISAGALGGDPQPKIARALGTAAARPPEVRIPTISPVPTAREVIHAAIAEATRRMIVHLPEAWVGVHPRGVHQARVAMRRLRSDLSTWSVLVDRRWADSLRSELRWLAHRLGPVRNMDVLIDLVTDLGEDHEDIDRRSLGALIGELDARRDVARAAMRSAIHSERTANLLDDLVAAAADPPTSPQADDPAAALMRPLVRRRVRRMKKAAERLRGDTPDEDLHRLRIHAKRVRYAAEAARPAAGAPAKRLAKRAAALQDTLGEINDARVAADVLSPIAAGGGDAAFAAGQVSGLLIAGAAQARDQWVDDWRKLRRDSVRGWRGK